MVLLQYLGTEGIVKFTTDWTLIICALLLSVIGILLIYSASPTGKLWVRQFVYLGIGIAVMVLLWRIPLRIHYSLGWIYYTIALVILCVALFQPSEVKRWVHIGPIGFQPSEFAKLAVAMGLARYLYDRKNDIEKPKVFIGAIILIAVPFAIVVGQPDLGTAMVFAAILGATLYTTGVSELSLFLLASPFLSIISAVHWIPWAVFFVILLAVLWFSRARLIVFLPVALANLFIGVITPTIWRNIHEYQKERILVFLDPGRDPFGAGYQIIQSKIAIGSGQFWGKGFLEGTQVKLAFLPAKHTDFIFAVLGEQFGFVGALVVLGLFFLLFYRILRIADAARNTYTRLVAIGAGMILFFGALVNIGMTTGLMPVTGLPLPFLSLGGSSLITSFAAIGLILNVHAHGVEGP